MPGRNLLLSVEVHSWDLGFAAATSFIDKKREEKNRAGGGGKQRCVRQSTATGAAAADKGVVGYGRRMGQGDCAGS